MLGEGRGEEILVGIVSLLVAGLLVRRVMVALRDGVIPIYRTRTTREEAGAAKFNALVALNIAATVLMALIAAELLLDLGWLR